MNMRVKGFVCKWFLAACAVVVGIGSMLPTAFAQSGQKSTDEVTTGPIGVHILVLEAQRTGGKKIDPRLKKAGLAKELVRLGYVNARVLDELEARVERGARVSLQMPGRRQNLQVKLLQARPKQRQFRLELSIPEDRFQMTTHHRDGGTVLIFLPARPSRPDIGLAVTPRR